MLWRRIDIHVLEQSVACTLWFQKCRGILSGSVMILVMLPIGIATAVDLNNLIFPVISLILSNICLSWMCLIMVLSFDLFALLALSFGSSFNWSLSSLSHALLWFLRILQVFCFVLQLLSWLNLLLNSCRIILLIDVDAIGERTPSGIGLLLYTICPFLLAICISLIPGWYLLTSCQCY